MNFPFFVIRTLPLLIKKNVSPSVFSVTITSFSLYRTFFNLVAINSNVFSDKFLNKICFFNLFIRFNIFKGFSVFKSIFNILAKSIT